MFAFGCLVIGFVSNGYLFYSLTFLNLFPDITCSESLPNCTIKDLCNHPDLVTINHDSTKTLENWVDRFDL
jgi:hypothetical protein